MALSLVVCEGRGVEGFRVAKEDWRREPFSAMQAPQRNLGDFCHNWPLRFGAVDHDHLGAYDLVPAIQAIVPHGSARLMWDRYEGRDWHPDPHRESVQAYHNLG